MLGAIANALRTRLSPALYLWICDRLYHEAAPLYDPVAALLSDGRWREWTFVAGRGLRGHVVEIGPGPGHLLADLRKRGVPAVAIELSSAMAHRSNRLAPGAVAQGDARRLPIRDASIEAMILTFPAPYVRECAFWEEATRVVRPGGRLRVLFDAGPAYASARDWRVPLVWPGRRIRIVRIWAGDDGTTLGMLVARRTGREERTA